MRKLYYLPDYGIYADSGEDCTEKLQAFFELVENGAAVQFQKGDYYVLGEVKIRGKDDIKIFGSNSRIIANFNPCGSKSENNDVFKFYDCLNLEIAGFTFDTNNPIGAAGEVIALDFEAKTVDVKIYDEFPVTGFEHFAATNSFDDKGAPDYALATYNNIFTECKTEMPDGSRGIRYIGLDYEVIGKNTVRLRLGRSLADKERCRLKIGHKINIRYEIYGNSVFSFAFCRRVLLKDILINSAASFGVAIEPRSSDFTFDNFSIRVSKGSRRLKAINADGIHILGLYGSLVMKNCDIEGLGDDALNIHGLATVVTELSGGELKMTGREYKLYNSIKNRSWADCGDIVDIYDKNTFLKTGSFTVKEQKNDGTLIFEGLKGKLDEGSVLANSTFYASVHIDGCTFKHTRARGVLIQTQNVLIENCIFYGLSYAAMLFSPDIRTWWEVGPAKNVEIRNNVIEYCAVIENSNNEGALVFKSSHEGDNTAYPAGVHEKIYIHRNIFRDIPNNAIFVSAANDVRIEENEFYDCCKNVRRPDCEYADYDIVALNCRSVRLEGNSTNRGEEKLFFEN